MATSKLAAWSRAVKERDGKCKHCGSMNDLHAHHVKPKATHPELRLDIANGITLCYRCHKREHDKNGFPRIRSKTPQRRTLQKTIDALKTANTAYKEQIKTLESELSKLRTKATPETQRKWLIDTI